MNDEVPEADVIDQRIGVEPEDEEDEPANAEFPIEANPADVADQHRVVPVETDDRT